MFSKKKVLSFLVILSLVLTTGQVSMAKRKSVVYTAIGDAIAQGVGGEYISETDPLKGYDDYLVEKIQDNSKENVILHNVAGRIDTSSDLLDRLMNDQAVIDAVSDADIITVSVGANNLILPVWPIFEQIFGGTTSYEDGINEILGMTGAFETGVDNFKSDWPKIVARIKELSPDAQIVATTMYNPFTLDHPLYDLADTYIAQINTEIDSLANKHSYDVADVYTEFSKFNGMGYNTMIHQDLPDIVHPTPLGYQKICNQIYNKLY